MISMTVIPHLANATCARGEALGRQFLNAQFASLPHGKNSSLASPTYISTQFSSFSPLGPPALSPAIDCLTHASSSSTSSP